MHAQLSIINQYSGEFSPTPTRLPQTLSVNQSFLTEPTRWKQIKMAAKEPQAEIQWMAHSSTNNYWSSNRAQISGANRSAACTATSGVNYIMECQLI